MKRCLDYFPSLDFVARVVMSMDKPVSLEEDVVSFKCMTRLIAWSYDLFTVRWRNYVTHIWVMVSNIRTIVYHECIL